MSFLRSVSNAQDTTRFLRRVILRPASSRPAVRMNAVRIQQARCLLWRSLLHVPGVFLLVYWPVDGLMKIAFHDSFGLSLRNDVR